MRVSNGDIVKVSDIGVPGRVLKTSTHGDAAVVEFLFPEGKVTCTIPAEIISHILETTADGQAALA